MLVRQAVRKWSIEQGFSLVDQTKMITAASELARNTLDYGGGGTVRLEALQDGIRKGVRLTFEDQGPGIADIDLALTDGYTTGKGMGMGLSGAQAARQRVRHPFAGRRGDARHDQRGGSDRQPPACRSPSRSTRYRRSERPGGSPRRWPAAWVSTRRVAAASAIVVTEAATNLFKHARGGVLVLQGLEAGRSVGLEVLALDRGPGMADVGRCMADGVSTAGSPGNGLGAIARLSSSFDIYSSTETGTAVLARLWHGADAKRRGAADWTFGVVSLPVAGEEVCGDAWAVDEQPGRTLVLVVDGLGHGLAAADAAREAVESFRRHAIAGP